MVGKVRKLILLLGLLPPLAAQETYPRHNLTFGAGAARPRGDLHRYLSDSSGVMVGYGYRFHRYFQADFGLDIVFGAARVREFLPTYIGDFRIKDREYFLPMGGRAIAPFFNGRLLVSGGGGGAWMRYNERVNQPSSYYNIDCPICTARSGWGYYAQANVNYFVDYYRHFRIGVGSRVYRGHTEGEPLGPVPGTRTRDKWVHIFGEVGLSF
jgi:hypothetical protein